jgi:hypothetical protein
MTTPQVQNDPIYTLPVLNINGLIVSNDATTPNTVLNISAGTARDSNNVMDITLGASNPNLEGSTVAAPLSLNAAVNGANGLDTGSFAASKVYAVYVIADSRYYQPTASLLSLATSAPQMPHGYDSYRLIGWAVSDSSTHFLPMFISGTGNARLFTYDAPQASDITAGNSGTYAAVNLTAIAPLVDNTPVYIASNWTANAAGDTFFLKGYNVTGDQFERIAYVAGATAHTLDYPLVLGQVASSKLQMKYKVSAGTVAINVAGFQFYV